MPWKIWTFLFQVTFMMDIIITAVFWTILYPDIDFCTADAPNGFRELRCVNLIGDHSLPVFCLLVDYTSNA